MPGPPPKRSDQRRRRNKPDESQPKLTVVKDDAPRPVVKAPRVSPSWHPLMKDWFRSLKESRQAMFYEPSDWQTARLLAEVMSQELNNGEGVKASMLAEFNRAAASLMTTEGERRRLRVELQAADGAVVDDESSSVMSHYKELFM
ncbi:hypothetical protein ACLI1L_000798 [Corynebacterium sp. LaCa117]|uniref:phage terminase small subunit n=1 Tax=Corynebacterium sp. LaCa117 TaxID=3391424 RepID=UPI00398A4C4A